MSSERASAGKITPDVPFTLSLSKTPVAGPALARRAARAPWSQRQLFLHGKAPDSEPGDREKEESSAERDHRRLSNENVDDEILCAVVLAARGVKGIQNKNKIGTSGARGWTCPESLPQGLGCPDPGDLWIASPKVVLFSISNVSCQKFSHVSVCSFVD